MLETKSIPEEIQFSIKEKGYDKLTTVQSLVLDPGNNDKDLLVSSQNRLWQNTCLWVVNIGCWTQRNSGFR